MADWKPTICENVPNIDAQTLRWAAQLGIEALALPGRLAVHPNDPSPPVAVVGLAESIGSGAQALQDLLAPS